MIFERRHMCALCRIFRRKSDMEFVYDKIGVCKACNDKIERLKGKCCLDESAESLVIAPYFYSGNLRKAVLDYKFNGQRLYGWLFGHMLAEELKDEPSIKGYDTVVPVPLHESRLKERGYNQSEIMAEVFADETGLAEDSDAVVRIKETKRQSGLTGADRIENVRDAFSANPDHVCGRKIILLDDISTMGMTMNSCKRALLKAGAAKVATAALCKTKLK